MLPRLHTPWRLPLTHQCPLLAICNVLLLRGTLKLHPDIASITAAQLIQLVGNLIIESNTAQVWLQLVWLQLVAAGAHRGSPAADTHACACPLRVQTGAAVDLNRQANVQAAVNVMPRLLVGLEVNVGFTQYVTTTPVRAVRHSWWFSPPHCRARVPAAAVSRSSSSPRRWSCSI